MGRGAVRPYLLWACGFEDAPMKKKKYHSQSILKSPIEIRVNKYI